MKKNVMALSIAAMIGGLGFAGVASASSIVGTRAAEAVTAKLNAPTAAQLKVSAGGVGHALVVPYFNAQNGNMTVLHVTNTDIDNGKVVKVRFRSAANSDDILDFQLFLSPGDVWTAAVVADADGLTNLVTADNSCTVPQIAKNTPVAFRKGNLPTFVADQNKLTREGYVEIFNIADISGDKAWTSAGGAGGTLNSPLFTATKHVNGVAPCSVAGSAARQALDNLAIANHTDEAATALLGLQSPTGQLAGDWYIQNVAQSTTFAGAATAIQALTADVAGPPAVPGANAVANFTHFPQLAIPAVLPGATTAKNFTADPLFRDDAVDAAGNVVAAVAKTLLAEDVPDLSTPMFGALTTDAKVQAANLLTALAVKSVSNQYALDASVSGKTDWVFSMPARRYNVVANYAAVTGTADKGATSANNAYRLFTPLTAGTDWFRPGAVGVGNTSVDAATGNICVYADDQKFWDREEATSSAGPTFSPGVSTKASFCGEVSVLAMGDTGASVLGAQVARSDTNPGHKSGWGRLDTTNKNVGLPIVGSSFIKLTNPAAAPGVMGTYGITWPHRYTK